MIYLIRIIFISLMLYFVVDSITDEAYSKYVEETDKQCPRNNSVAAELVECTHKQIQKVASAYLTQHAAQPSVELSKYVFLDILTFEYRERKQLIFWYKREMTKLDDENLYEKYIPPEYLRLFQQTNAIKRSSKMLEINYKKIKIYRHEIDKLEAKPFENNEDEVNFLYDIEDLQKITKAQEYILKIMILEEQNSFIKLMEHIVKKNIKKLELR